MKKVILKELSSSTSLNNVVFKCVADYLKGDLVQADCNVKYDNDCRLPKLGESVEVDGKKGRVCELNVLSGNYKVKVSDNEEIIVSVDIDGNN